MWARIARNWQTRRRRRKKFSASTRWRPLLQWRRDQGMRRCRNHGDVAKVDDVRREVGRPFRQAGLRLQTRGECLSLPGRRGTEILLHEGGERAEVRVLLDKCLPRM